MFQIRKPSNKLSAKKNIARAAERMDEKNIMAKTY